MGGRRKPFLGHRWFVRLCKTCVPDSEGPCLHRGGWSKFGSVMKCCKQRRLCQRTFCKPFVVTFFRSSGQTLLGSCFLRSFQNRGAPGLSCAILNLGATKTSQRVGASDSVTLSVGPVCARLKAWKERSNSTRVLVTSEYQFRRDFASALHELGLDAWAFRPYSLRRGEEGLLCFFAKAPVWTRSKCAFT